MPWPVIVGLAAASLLVLWVAVAKLGRWRWDRDTLELRSRLNANRQRGGPTRVDARAFGDLPPPVQRFFKAALMDGQAIVAGVELAHSGTFDMSGTGQGWQPVTSAQRVITRRPGFVWDARIRLIPGIAIRVYDAYVSGEGIVRAAISGVVTVANLRGGGEMARGELLRFLAEAAWYPTALLPSQNLRWDRVDDRSARATLTDGSESATLLFRFSAAGLIESVRADARGRIVGGRIVPTPWEGRLWNYRLHDGMHIPTDGEVGWMLAAGFKPYWRGRLDRIVYEYLGNCSSDSGSLAAATATVP